MNRIVKNAQKQNCGCLKHAYALLVDGGTFNDRTIESIGFTRAAHIYWRAGATYQVPVEVTRRRAQALAIRTIVETCRGRGGKPMAERLADEIAQAFRKEGASITWRENTHKMAEANKLFAHYAW